jgi:hypothetical protein
MAMMSVSLFSKRKTETPQPSIEMRARIASYEQKKNKIQRAPTKISHFRFQET